MLYLMCKYAMRMGNDNAETAKRLLEDRRFKEKIDGDVGDKKSILDTIVTVILYLFPVILFIDSSIVLVKNFSSYERFVAIYEK